MKNAITIANFFVLKGLETNDKTMTPMKVLKLTYLAYCWYLAIEGKRLFRDPIEAWQYGPVVPAVYQAFRHYGRGVVTQPVPTGEDLEDDGLRRLLNRVWDVYKDYSGLQLSALTHQAGTPWEKTWARVGRDTTIPDAEITAHYKAKMDNA